MKLDAPSKAAGHLQYLCILVFLAIQGRSRQGCLPGIVSPWSQILQGWIKCTDTSCDCVSVSYTDAGSFGEVRISEMDYWLSIEVRASYWLRKILDQLDG